MLHPGRVNLRNSFHVEGKNEAGSLSRANVILARHKVLLDLLGVGLGKYRVNVERLAELGVEELVTFARPNFLNQFGVGVVLGQVVQISVAFVDEVKRG